MQGWSGGPAQLMKVMAVKLTHEQLVELVLMDEPRKVAKCKHCGEGNLQWVQYKAKTNNGWADKWMLLGVGPDGLLKRHTCEQFKKIVKGVYDG